ncbi:MAG: CvpA family protein [Thermosulfidibacteraceae bacterium]|jgi:membrane protein required for colicin V production
MNWFDLITLVLVVIFAFSGFRKGLIRELLSLTGTFISLFVAYKFNNSFYLKVLSVSFVNSELIGRMLAFITLFLITKLVIMFLTQMVETGLKVIHLTIANRISGLVIGIIKGLTIASFIFILVNGIAGERPFENSKLLPLVEWYINIIKNLIRAH